MEWVADLIASIPSDAHWATRRRIAILSRFPAHLQHEAMLDHANGDSSKLDSMNADIAAIKAAIPKQ